VIIHWKHLYGNFYCLIRKKILKKKKSLKFFSKQFFSKLNQKNNAREVKELNNTDYSGSEAAIVDNDAGILDITEALDKTILSTNNML
jgi:hypothetical protein